MNTIKTYSALLLFLLVTTAASAQYIQVDNSYTAQQLVNALVGNSCAQVSNISASGVSGTGTSPSYGYFNQATSSFPFTGGIVLSSGYAASAPGPNGTDALSQGPETWDGDSDLEDAINTQNTYNATVLEFDFIPVTNNISFDYIFASEEYLQNPDSPSWCNYSDGFAFLIKPAGSTGDYENLAVIPGTTTPVKVTTVRGPGYCDAANEEYFNGYNAVNSPINFNGQTVILTASAEVTAGTTYHIKLVVADQGDTQYDSAIFLGEGSFTSVTDLGENRLLADGNPLCNGEALPLDGSTSGAVSYQWYKNDVAITGAINAQYTVTTAGIYRVEALLAAGCYSKGEIELEYAPVISTAAYNYYQCDENGDGLTAYYLAQISAQLITANPDYTVLNYYTSAADANAGINPITTADANTPYYNTTAGQTIYANVKNTYGCVVNIPVILSVPAPVTTTALAITGQCDTDGNDDGFTAFSLTPIAATLLAAYPSVTSVSFYSTYPDAISYSHSLQNTFTNTVASAQTLYARLDTTAGCNTIIAVPLQVYTFGTALAPDEAILCNSTPIVFDAGAGYSAYSWNTTPVQTTQQITVTAPGTYTVTLTTAEGCTGTKNFTAVQSGAASGATYSIKDFRGSANSLEITAEGYGTYQYSLDAIHYQDSPLFENLSSGHYTYYIKDINGCGPIYSESLYILDYPLYFTPNGDNVQDKWRIPYMTTRPGLSVTIFDRFGKLITGFGYNSAGWDGTLNGRPLPADDYWFVITLEDSETVKGHFALIR